MPVGRAPVGPTGPAEPVGSLTAMRSSHGQTPAGWISVTVILVGSVVAGFGIGAASVTLTAVGGGVMLVGLLLAPVLQKMGYGQYPPANKSRSYANAEAYLGARREDEGDPTGDPTAVDTRAGDRELTSGT